MKHGGQNETRRIHCIMDMCGLEVEGRLANMELAYNCMSVGLNMCIAGRLEGSQPWACYFGTKRERA